MYLTTSAPARVVARGRGGRIRKPVPVAVPSWDVPVTGGPKLQPAAPTKDANDWVFALSDGDVEVAAALVCAHLHRSIAVADVADASRWCSAVTRLLMNENAEVPALASRSAQKNDVIGALLGAVRMPPQKKRSQVAHSQMQRAALEALSTFFTRPASSTCSQEARAMAAKLGGTRSVFIALNATADAPDPRSDPNEEDPRVTLTLAALAALDSLLGDRNPFGRAHNSILVGELQRVVELGGASLISTLAAIGIRDESVTYHALRLFESLSKKVLDLPAHVQHYAPARCDRLMSDGAVEQVLRSMSAHPKSLRSQVCGLRVIAAVCDGAETSSSSANRAELLVNDGAVRAILAAMAEHATSLDVALAGSWALFGLCVGDAAPARKRSRRAADEGALLALASVVDVWAQSKQRARGGVLGAVGGRRPRSGAPCEGRRGRRPEGGVHESDLVYSVSQKTRLSLPSESITLTSFSSSFGFSVALLLASTISSSIVLATFGSGFIGKLYVMLSLTAAVSKRFCSVRSSLICASMALRLSGFALSLLLLTSADWSIASRKDFKLAMY